MARSSSIFSSLMGMVRPPSQHWRTVAGQLGLVRHVGGNQPTLSGTFCGKKVKIGVNELGYRVEVDGAPRGLRLSAEPFVGGQRDITVGDPQFDRLVHLQVDELHLVGLLSANVRKRTIDLVGQGVVVDSGVAGVRRMGSTPNPQEVKKLVVEMTELVSSLGPEEDKVAEYALFRNFCDDPLTTVRKRNLEILLHHYPGLVATEATRKGRNNDDAKIQFLCAEYSRDVDILIGLVRGELANEAWRAMLKLGFKSECESIVREIMEDSQIPLTENPDVLHWLGELKLNDLVDLSMARVEALMKSSGKKAMTIKVLEAFSQAMAVLDAPGAASLLLKIAAEPVGGARVAAVKALGVVGTVDVVEPLRQLGSMQTTVQTSIAQIQARAGGNVGALSLAEVGGGELSLAAEDGALSIVDQD